MSVGATTRRGGSILLTGWRGNTGSAIVRELRQRFPERQLIGITRSPQRDDVPEEVLSAVTPVTANLDDEASVEKAFTVAAAMAEDISLVVHIAHITYTPLMLRLSDAYRVSHAICLHTTGIYSRFERYTEKYREVENNLFAHPPQFTRYTVLRPTMIYGTPRDRNMHKLILHLARKPFIPLFGNGASRMQPVHVDDLAKAVVACVENEQVYNRAYDLSGGSEITYAQAVNLICDALQVRPLRVRIPLGAALPLVKAYNALVKKPVVTVEQVERLTEDKCYAHDDARRDLNFTPRPFEQGIRDEIGLMTSAGLISRKKQRKMPLFQ